MIFIMNWSLSPFRLPQYRRVHSPLLTYKTDKDIVNGSTDVFCIPGMHCLTYENSTDTQAQYIIQNAKYIAINGP